MSRQVEVTIVEDEVDGADGVRGTCTDCGHRTESKGTSDAARRRVLALMRVGCPNKSGPCPQENFYVDADAATAPPPAKRPPAGQWQPERPPWMK